MNFSAPQPILPSPISQWYQERTGYYPPPNTEYLMQLVHASGKPVVLIKRPGQVYDTLNNYTDKGLVIWFRPIG